jgi:hypothetical protein
MLDLDPLTAPSATPVARSSATLLATAYGAVVLAADEVRWQTATRTLGELIDALAAYVAARAPEMLWPEDAEEVARCLAAGEPGPAVRHYFAATGRRWDRERLHWVVPMPIPTGPAA